MFFCLCYMLKVEHCESPQSHRLDFCGWLSQLQCEPHKPVAKWCMPHTESQTKYRYKVVEITNFLKVIGIKKRIHDRRLSRQGEKELLCSQYLFSEVLRTVDLHAKCLKLLVTFPTQTIFVPHLGCCNLFALTDVKQCS